MLCDRNVSLPSITGDYRLNLKYCTLHIIRNVAAKFKQFNQHHKNLIWQLQTCGFEGGVQELKWDIKFQII